MKSFYGVFFIVIAFSGLGQTLDGKVYGYDGSLVPCEVFSGGEQGFITSSEKGEFSLFQQSGFFDLLIKSQGYQPYELKLKLENDSLVRIVLTPDSSFVPPVLEVHSEDLADSSVLSDTLKHIEISSTNPFQNTSLTTETISSEEMSNVNAQNVGEAVKYAPGVRTETNCQNCGFSQVTINGLPGVYSQVLINGASVYSNLNSIYGLEQIPSSFIDRIEVVRSGGSVATGAGAIAGSINIVTRDPDSTGLEIKNNLRLINGTRPNNNLSFNGAYVTEDQKHKVILGGVYAYRSPVDINADGYTEIPQQILFGGNVKYVFTPSQYSKTDVEVAYTNEYRRGGDSLNLLPEEASIAEQLKSNILLSTVRQTFFTKDFKHKFVVNGAFQGTNMDNYYGAEFDPDGYGLTKAITALGGFSHSYFYKPGKHTGDLTSGVEYKYEYLSDAKPGYDAFVNQQMNNVSLYAINNFNVNNKYKITAGVRAEYSTLINAVLLAPQVGVNIPIKDAGLKANFTYGYRLPQYFSADIHTQIVGGEIQVVRLASDLGVENSFNYSLEYYIDKTWGKHDFEFQGQVFYIHIDNPYVLVATQQGGLNVLEKRNGPGLDVLGSNVTFNHNFNNKVISTLSATYQYNEYQSPVEWTDGEYTKVMLRSPNFFASLSNQVVLPKGFSTYVTGVFTGSMWVPHLAGYIVEDELKHSPSFFDLGVAGAYELPLANGLKLEFKMGVMNVLNQFQKDLDVGLYKDPSYVYGPQMPITPFINLKLTSF